jgi:PTH1 family peptidyl-tRNA hydrolase
MKVVIGLGNPGSRYRGTRHNVGFDVVDYLAANAGFRSRFQAQTAEIKENGEPVLLVKPETFMNLSGRCVREVLDFYKLPVEAMLVVCDDINLPLGKLRVRTGGSHGGHNGLRNIQEHLSTLEYARLRIGVDAPRSVHDDATVDHVLGRFAPGERPVIEDAVAKAAAGVLVWIRSGIGVCMNRVNAGPERPKKEKKKDDAAGEPARDEDTKKSSSDH